ncbi:MAG TPA: hypothetical protein VH740_19580 [Vicinamibacterales bacterium]|jgi:hypothetical protein
MKLLLTLAVMMGLASGPPSEKADQVVRCGIDMRNVSLHAADGIVLAVRTLDGELAGRSASSPPGFDNPGSYVLRIQSAEISMDAASLTTLMRTVFAQPSPVKDLEISIAQGELVQKGKLRKGIDVPFTMKTTVAPTADGRIRLHAKSLKTIGLPVKGLLDFFGVALDDLMKTPSGRGITIDGDDILLSPAQMLPPPATEGNVKDVRVSGDRLVMTMVGDVTPPARPRTLPEPASRNYVYFHGGSVRFGKLTMRDADLQLTDADASDPFDFFPAQYLSQLVAGYSRTTERGGLKVVMPDYGDLKTARGRVRPPLVNR